LNCEQKATVLLYLKVYVSWYLSETTEENHETPPSQQLMDQAETGAEHFQKF
jgi:hypothetical protein